MAFTAKEAARLGRVSAYQLRSWAKDLYSPHWDSGLYSFQDLVALRALSALRDRVPRQRLVEVGSYLNERYGQPWTRIKFGVGPKRRVYYWDPETQVWLSADVAQQSITPVALDGFLEELEREVAKARRRDPSTIGKVQTTRGVCGGRPRFDGTRIPVATVQELIRARVPDKEILGMYPSLKRADLASARK
jgi:uncharacterized protein (DUF433 family)